MYSAVLWSHSHAVSFKDLDDTINQICESVYEKGHPHQKQQQRHYINCVSFDSWYYSFTSKEPCYLCNMHDVIEHQQQLLHSLSSYYVQNFISQEAVCVFFTCKCTHENMNLATIASLFRSGSIHDAHYFFKQVINKCSITSHQALATIGQQKTCWMIFTGRIEYYDDFLTDWPWMNVGKFSLSYLRRTMQSLFRLIGLDWKRILLSGRLKEKKEKQSFHLKKIIWIQTVCCRERERECCRRFKQNS